jgi:hypothetical protein
MATMMIREDKPRRMGPDWALLLAPLERSRGPRVEKKGSHPPLSDELAPLIMR